jgi:hypothetical protein
MVFTSHVYSMKPHGSWTIPIKNNGCFLGLFFVEPARLTEAKDLIWVIPES